MGRENPIKKNLINWEKQFNLESKNWKEYQTVEAIEIVYQTTSSFHHLWMFKNTTHFFYNNKLCFILSYSWFHVNSIINLCYWGLTDNSEFESTLRVEKMSEAKPNEFESTLRVEKMSEAKPNEFESTLWVIYFSHRHWHLEYFILFIYFI